MLKKEIKYTDFDGESQTEIVEFNLTKTELQELQFGSVGGFASHIERAMETGNVPTLFIEFKKLILGAYGERSEDRKRFIKSPEIAEAFTQTMAYDALFDELMSNDGALLEFIKGIMPKDVIENIDIGAIQKEAAAKFGTGAELAPPEAPNG